MKRNNFLFWVIIAILLLIVGCSKDNSNDAKEATNHSTNSNEKEEMKLPDVALEKGDEGDSVKALQKALKKIGYPVDISSIFDDLTTWAITDIQLQQPTLSATGLYDASTMNYLQSLIDQESSVDVGKAIHKPEHPDTFPDLIENPYDILAIANKGHALPGDYIPNDLVIPDIRFPFEDDDPKKQMRKIAADAIEELFAAGDADGVTLFAQSGYRSYDRQVAIFASNTEIHGEEHANTYSAKAGESEHQTGLVMDVTSQDIGFDLTIEFGETDEGKWLKDHAHEYGFIIRYPEDKVNITKYQYEPWHIRYVGKNAAAKIYENGSTLEEYFDLQ